MEMEIQYLELSKHADHFRSFTFLYVSGLQMSSFPRTASLLWAQFEPSSPCVIAIQKESYRLFLSITKIECTCMRIPHLVGSSRFLLSLTCV